MSQHTKIYCLLSLSYDRIEAVKNRNPSAADDAAAPASGMAISPADYIRVLRTHLRNHKQVSASGVADDALKRFPKNPLIVSYHGLLQSLVDGKHRSAVDSCRRAFTLLSAEDAYSASVVYPLLYPNLGKACLAAGMKKDAVEAFQKGIGHERGNPELIEELKRLGIRKAPVVPFLSRSNPINKYLGRLLHDKHGGDGVKHA